VLIVYPEINSKKSRAGYWAILHSNRWDEFVRLRFGGKNKTRFAAFGKPLLRPLNFPGSPFEVLLCLFIFDQVLSE
jgi:hypothetical protein